MTGRIFLHIGAMKTGTRYIQQLLTANRASLREAGLLVPGRRSLAVHDVIDYRAAGPEHLQSARGSWDRMVDKVRDFDGHGAVLSHEFLGLKGLDKIDRIAGTLSGLEIHLVITLRDATATLPAQWQTAARNHGALTWPAYAEAARVGVRRAGLAHVRDHTFLYSQRIGRMLDAWAEHVSGDRVHAVTVPAAGAPQDELWSRLAGVLGVDRGAATDLEIPANPSAGYASSHLLCLLHQASSGTVVPDRQAKRLLVHLAERATERRALERRPPLDEATLDFAAQWNRKIRRVVAQAGADVVGSIDDLPVTPDLSRAEPMVDPADSDVVEAARHAYAALGELIEDSEPSTEIGPHTSVADAVALTASRMSEVWRQGGLERLSTRGRALTDEDG